MAKRQVFFSFEFMKDNWRAGQVRNMGKVDGNSTFSDNDWEEVKEKTDSKIKQWIDEQLQMRSCLVVLIGSSTSGRKWINYEIDRAYEMGKGIVGIYVHGLEDSHRCQTQKGSNPFYNRFTKDGERLSKYVNCYDPPYSSSKNVYSDIEKNIEALIEEAISNRRFY